MSCQGNSSCSRPDNSYVLLTRGAFGVSRLTPGVQEQNQYDPQPMLAIRYKETLHTACLDIPFAVQRPYAYVMLGHFFGTPEPVDRETRVGSCLVSATRSRSLAQLCLQPISVGQACEANRYAPVGKQI